MSRLTRRELLEGSAAAVAASALARTTGARSANEQVTVAIVGLRTRGKSLAQEFTELDDVRIAAVCDVDESMFGPTCQVIEESGRKRPERETDVRRLIDRKDIDALVLATPDHWHAHPTIWACQAGKDVYVEKPISHNLVEGRRMVEAARRHRRVVQVGTQRRSSPHWTEAMEVIRSGRLGKVSQVRTWLFNTIASIGHPENTSVPPGVDYDLWLGPAPRRPFNPGRFHYDWHWFWDYGTGQMGNNGIHFLDIARWGLGLEYPTHVSSGGGKLHFDDDTETPDTQVVNFDYSDVLVTWEHRVWSAHGLGGRRYGIEFHGDRATLLIDNVRWEIFEDDQLVEQSAAGTTLTVQHLRNFIDCIRTRERPAADIEEGHISSALCHIGNIAHRTGRRLRFDSQSEKFPDDPEVDVHLARTYAEGWDLPAV
jgi:predicted dehydrogenase